MSKSSLFILSFNFHYVSLMLKFPDPAKKRGGEKRKSMPKKKVGKSVPKERGGKKSVPKREETCRKERKRHSEKRRGHRQVR